MHAFANPGLVGRCSLSMAGNEERRDIYRMRHEVYARELHQHPENDRGELTDSLDGYNLYIVAKLRGIVVGFVSVTPPPGPYSLDKYMRREKWPVAVGTGTYEIRLLTVTDEARGTTAGAALMYAAMRYVQSRGGTHVVGIGREQVLPMYVRAGMKPCGLTVNSGAVTYHVMAAEVMELEAVQSANKTFVERMLQRMNWNLDFPVRKVAGCFHGGVSIGAAGARFERLSEAKQTVNADVLDAWFDPSPRVIEALRDHLPWLARTSPPADCRPLVAAVAESRGVPQDSVVPGAGSSDLIFRCLREWLTRDSKLLLLDPTYGEYAHVLERVIGCRVERFRLDRQAGYALDVTALAERLRQPYDLAVLVNPNSPTGTFVPRNVLGPLLTNAACAPRRVWVDETYVDYVGQEESLEQLAVRTPGLVVCKSMSKAYALSGMRVAYLCGHPEQMASVRAITPPWVVGLAAQVAAVRALEDPAYYAQRYADTRVHRAELIAELRALGLRVLDGVANFVLLESPIGAAEMVRRCIECGVYLRDVGSMGMDDQQSVRIAVKSRQDNRRIVEAIREALAGPANPGLYRPIQMTELTSLIST